jgi:methyl-accepting chemotaxis protein
MANETKQYAQWIDVPNQQGGSDRKWMKDAESLHFTETADPASEDVIDEYQRLTGDLYQALEDAQQVITPAQTATSEAQAATDLAQQAAANADNAAAAANSAADAATDAAAQVEDARGGYQSLSDRLDATAMGFVENSNPMSLLV